MVNLFDGLLLYDGLWFLAHDGEEERSHEHGKEDSKQGIEPLFRLNGILMGTGGIAYLLGGGALGRVDVETGMDEPLDVRLHTRYLWHGHLATELGLSASLTEGHLSGENLTKGGTESPDVALWHGLHALLEALGRHVGQRAAVLVVVVVLMLIAPEVGTDAEVGDGIVLIVVDEHVGRLHVLVDDRWRAGVQVVESRGHIVDESP